MKNLGETCDIKNLHNESFLWGEDRAKRYFLNAHLYS